MLYDGEKAETMNIMELFKGDFSEKRNFAT